MSKSVESSGELSGQSYPDRADLPVQLDVAHIDLGGTLGWIVSSEFGVVKMRSTTGNYMLAVGPTTARGLARSLAAALDRAADLTEIRSYGKVYGDVARDG